MKKNLLTSVLILFVFCILKINAQNADVSVYDLNRTATENPQYTLRTFFESMSKNNYYPENAVRTMDFSSATGVNKKSIAIKLKKIFDAKGIMVNISRASLNKNYIDTATMTQVYKISNELPEIFLQKVGNKWLFSSYSVSKVQEIYDKIFPFDASWIVDKLPDVFRFEFLGVELWQYAGLAIFIIIAYLIAKLLKYISKFIIKKILERFNRGEAAKAYVLPISKRLSQLLGMLIFMGVLPTLELPHKLNYGIMLVVKVAVPIFIVIIVFRIIDAVMAVFRRIASSTPSTIDDILVPFIRKGLKIVFFIFAVFYVLDILNVNIAPLIAGVSIGGLAFALAAQDTVKNLLGSITIFADNPFAVGDWIKFANGEGTIEDIGLRSTRIRTAEDSLISIPNGKLMDMAIDNLGRRQFRRYNFNIQLVYSTSKELLLNFISEVRRITEANENINQDNIQISFYNFSDSSIDIRVALFFKTTNLLEELKFREEFNFEIYTLAGKMGVEFAFPSQTIYMDDSNSDISKNDDNDKDHFQENTEKNGKDAK